MRTIYYTLADTEEEALAILSQAPYDYEHYSHHFDFVCNGFVKDGITSCYDGIYRPEAYAKETFFNVFNGDNLVCMDKDAFIGIV